MSEVGFQPFQRVLVRHIKNQAWLATFFSHTQLNSEGITEYVCANASAWKFCIPYNEETAHLLGTTNDPTPPEPEFKWGDHVEVSDNGNDWIKAVYVAKHYAKSHKAYSKVFGMCSWIFCRHADW